MAVAIAQAESSRYVNVVNRNPSPPTDDLGLWQINDYYHSNSIGHASGSELYDADRLYNLNLYTVASVKAYNAAAAFAVSNSGTNWTQWATFYNFDQVNHNGDANFAGYGAYKSYLGDARYWASLADPATVLTGPNQNVVAEQGVNVRNSPGGSAAGLAARVAGDKGVVLSGPSALTQVGGTGPWFIWWQIRWSDGEVGWSIENNLSKTTAAGTTTIFTMDGNGVPVSYCPLQIDGQSVGSTDQNGRLSLPLLCGSHRVRAVLGYLFYDAFINFICQNANGDILSELQTEVLGPSAMDASSSADVELESTVSCANLSPSGNFSIGDTVEVFGTGNGLRARYPNPCSDSYAVMPDLSVGTIVGAAQCCNGYTRWKIRYDGLAGIDVWSAEGEPSTGQMFLRKKQSSTCSYSLAPAHLDLDTFGGAASGFNVTAGSSCYWTAIANQNWISITTNASGNGAKQVTFSVEANTGSVSRSGAITVADQIFTITQPGTAGPTPTPSSTPGALALSTNNIFVGKQDGGGTILVYNKDSGVINWTASTSTPWLTLLTPYGTATGNGTSLSFNYDQNPGGPQRAGTITVTSAGATGSPQTLTVTQGGSDGASITITNIFSPATVDAGTENVSVAWSETSAISQQVLFLLTLYPTGQTSIRYDIKHDFFYLTIPAGSSRHSVGFDFPANMYSGLYDVEISFWSDKNSDGMISSGDILLGLDKAMGITRVNGTQPPIPVLHISTDAITVGAGSGGANLLVSNIGDGTLNWSAATGDDWITMETASSSNTGGATASLSFSFQQNPGTNTRSGTINVTASGASGSPQSISVTQLGRVDSVRAGNISTRLKVGTGDNAVIGGFIITGSQPKNVVIRGIGPSLAPFGIADTLPDPTLELRDSTGALLIANDNWQNDPAQASQLTGLNLALQNPKEAGIFATLQPGAFSAILTGNNQTGGIGLVEIYDTDSSANAQLANISTRGFVLTGDNVMIGGVILGGNGSTSVAVRGIGPSLAAFGLSPVLADPTLALHDSNGSTLIANDDWQDAPEQAAGLNANDLAPQNPKESGIFTSLPPGPFTAILAGKGGGTGIGLVEVYNLH